MHVFKFLPLKSYTKIFSPSTTADQESDPDHVLQCVKEWWQSLQLPSFHEEPQPYHNHTPNQIYLRARCSSSAEHLKHSAQTKRNREVSFHELFNPSLLHSF